MFPGTKILSLMVFLVTVGWAVMGQDIFGREHIQMIGQELSHRVSEKLHIDEKSNPEAVVAEARTTYQTSYLVRTEHPLFVKKKRVNPQ